MDAIRWSILLVATDRDCVRGNDRENLLESALYVGVGDLGQRMLQVYQLAYVVLFLLEDTQRHQSEDANENKVLEGRRIASPISSGLVVYL